MDLKALQQHILSRDKSDAEKAQMFTEQDIAYKLTRSQWQTLIYGVPDGIVKAIAELLRSPEPRVEDTSEMLCEGLLQPALHTLPQTPDQLADILFAQPAHPIPIDKNVYSKLTANLQKVFVVDDGSGAQLARIFANQLTSRLWLVGGEQAAVHNVNMCLIVPLLGIDELAIGSCQDFEPVRNKGDPDRTMTLLSAKGVSLRPDGVIRRRDDHRLLMKWEEKPDSLKDAVADLKGKTARWSKLYYGQLPYLVTFAATQAQIQFYIITRDNVTQPKAVGPKIMLNKQTGRVRLLLAALNLHRILQAVETYLPQEVSPLDQPQIRECPEA